jgi:hypothetical protein
MTTVFNIKYSFSPEVEYEKREVISAQWCERALLFHPLP